MGKPGELGGNPGTSTIGGRRSARVVAETTRLAVLGEELFLRADELDRLVDALARLGRRDADAVAEQIGALRLAGGVIRLMPTEAELAAVESALARADEARPVGPALLCLGSVCAGNDSRDSS